MKFKLNIRRRMMFAVLSTSLATLLILSGVMFYGMNGVRELALETAEEIGVQSALNSNDALEDQKTNELLNLASDKAVVIDQRLRTIASDVEMTAAELTYINEHPYLFLPQAVSTHDQTYGEDVAFYIQHSMEFDRAAFASVIGLTANIRDFLIRSVETNDMAEAMSAASRFGFMITAENNRDIPLGDRLLEPLIYDVPSSNWYRRAESDRKLIFTEVQRLSPRKVSGMFCAAPYFDAEGNFAGVACARMTLERINTIVSEVSLHGEGFCFVLDNRGRVILSSGRNVSSEDNPIELAIDLSHDVRLGDNPELTSIAIKMVNGERGVLKASVNGDVHYIAYAPIAMTGWSFAVVIRETVVTEPIITNAELIKELTKKRRAALDDHMQQTMMYFGVFIVLLLIATAYVGRRQSDHFIEPIHQLADGVREISTGDLNKKLDIKTGDEIESLAISFNAMTDELKTYMKNLTKITADKERIATELDVANRIQASMLPNIFPPFPDRKEFDIYATMHAAKEVGGDFYDFYMPDEDHLIVTIADVSGKGVPAALFMVISKTILKNSAMSMDGVKELAAVVTNANRQLCQNNDEMMFVTVFMAVLDLRTGEMVYVSGGHNPPLVKRAERFEYLTLKKSWALGINDRLQFRQESLRLSAGDVVFLYTDGVTEAMNEAGEQYSEARLLETLSRIGSNRSVEEMLSVVRRDVKEHVRGAEQSDDITMLAVKINALDGRIDKN